MSDPSQVRRLSIRILGDFEVCDGDRVVLGRGWSRRKAQSVIKLLTVRPGHALHREEVLDHLWPHLDADAALNNLHKNLHHIRAALAEADLEEPLVQLRGDVVELHPATAVDVDRFRALVAQALSGHDIEAYEEAAALYGGDLLPDDVYEEWTLDEREELRRLYVELLLGLAGCYERDGRPRPAIEALQRLLRSDPLNEDAHRRLMCLYSESGSRHRALRQFQQLKELLERELQVEPAAETMRVYEELVSDGDRGSTERDADTDSAAITAAEAKEMPHAYGRERELEAALGTLRKMASRRGIAVLISGEAGIGKSQLLERVVAEARREGFHTFVSRCSQLESSVAYQPFRDILQQAAGVEEFDEFIRRSLYLRLLLYGADERESPSRDPNVFQAELFGEVHRLIQAISQARPLVIVLDDVHAADEESIRLLHYIARRLDGTRVAMLASHRPTETEHNPRIVESIASLRREGLVEELELEPLGEAAITSLVEGLLAPHPVSKGLVREVIERSDGNPLFAGELVRTFVREGWAELIDGRWERQRSGMAPIPTAVQDLIDLRLRKLSQPAQQKLHLAAVYGREFDYPTLRTALGMNEYEAVDALEECLDADIIEEAPDGYRFRHDLLRDAIYSRLTRVRREALHKLLARTLTAKWTDAVGSPDVERIARHYDLSDERERAIPYLIESARRAAAVFANDQAIALYERACSLVAEHPTLSKQEHAALVDSLADLVRRRGNAARSAELFEEAYGLFSDAGDTEGAVKARSKAALGQIVLGDTRRAKELITATLADVSEQSPLNVVARTHYLLAQLHWHSGEHSDALEAAERSLAAASASGDPIERAQACEVMALACHSMGDWQRGVELELERQSLGVPGFDTDEAFDAHL